MKSESEERDEILLQPPVALTLSLLIYALSLSLSRFVFGGLSCGALTICRYDTTPGIVILCTRGDRSFAGAFVGADACRAALGFFASWLALAGQLLIVVRSAQSCVVSTGSVVFASSY